MAAPGLGRAASAAAPPHPRLIAGLLFAVEKQVEKEGWSCPVSLLMILPAEKPRLFCLNIPPFPMCSDCCKAERFGDYLIDKPGQDPQTTCVSVPEGFALFPEHA